MWDEICILGSACDPISNHHLRMAELVTMHTGMHVWIMPCWHHRFSKNDRLADPIHRWAMVCLATVNRSPFLMPCSFEILRKHEGSMYQTVKAMQEQYNRKFRIMIGMDNANIVPTHWDRGAQLIQEVPFIVFPRKGEAAKVNWFEGGNHMIMEMDYHISSTAIREAIASGNYAFAESHLGPEVWHYIKRERLYGYHD